VIHGTVHQHQVFACTYASSHITGQYLNGQSRERKYSTYDFVYKVGISGVLDIATQQPSLRLGAYMTILLKSTNRCESFE
jgi:hypothetical protein